MPALPSAISSLPLGLNFEHLVALVLDFSVGHPHVAVWIERHAMDLHEQSAPKLVTSLPD